MSKLRIRRKAAKISQSELARQLGCGAGAVCHAEKKGIKTIRLARMYAGILGCEPLELLESVRRTAAGRACGAGERDRSDRSDGSDKGETLARQAKPQGTAIVDV